MKTARYTEPDGYFPKEIRKKYKLGEYNEEVYPKKTTKKSTAKKTAKKSK